jgi:YD repeat-containing protein
MTRAFDELSRLIAQTTGPNKVGQFAYDKVGNTVSTTSPAGHATTAAFDPLDRLVTTVAPDSGSTTLAYDARDRLTGHNDPSSVTTQFVHDGFGQVIQETSPDRGTNTYWYDAAGRLTQSSDGRGQVIAYAHDWLGRVTSKTPQSRPSSEVINYTWDTGGLSDSYGAGRLARIDDGSGATLFGYDHRGNLIGRQQTVGATSAAMLAYTYDLADRIDACFHLLVETASPFPRRCDRLGWEQATIEPRGLLPVWWTPR